MTAGSPRPSTHPAGIAANTRQTDTIIALFAAGKSLDGVAEVGATTRVGGWTRARAEQVRSAAVIAGLLPARPVVPVPRAVAPPVNPVARYRAMTVEQLLAHCRAHPSRSVRQMAAAADAHQREADRLTALLRQNLPSVEEARQLLDGQQRRRGDAR